MGNPTTFREGLQTLINTHSQENGSNTPDFILTRFLLAQLRAFDEATNSREKHYGRARPKTGAPPEGTDEVHPTCPHCGRATGNVPLPGGGVTAAVCCRPLYVILEKAPQPSASFVEIEDADGKSVALKWDPHTHEGDTEMWQIGPLFESPGFAPKWVKWHISKDGTLTLWDVFNGIGIKTDQGLIGVAQRDSGVEVVLNLPDGRQLLWSSTSEWGNDPKNHAHKLRPRARVVPDVIVDTAVAAAEDMMKGKEAPDGG